MSFSTSCLPTCDQPCHDDDDDGNYDDYDYDDDDGRRESSNLWVKLLEESGET